MNFEADFKRNAGAYSATSFFKEVNLKKINHINRLNSYHASIMHFLTITYEHYLGCQGFESIRL